MAMTAASFALWLGVPVVALWVGSQVQAQTDSLGLAVLSMIVSAAATIFLLLRLLSWLDLRHAHARERRGLETYGNVTLEGVMVMSAGCALVSFCIWFFLFSGSSPLPVSLGS